MKKKHTLLIVSAVFLITALALWAVLYTTHTATRRFDRLGAKEMLRIVAFREVSSGPAPNTRTIAIAEPLNPIPGTPYRVLASHILMGSSEVSALRLGQTLPALTLRDELLPATMQLYQHWFLTPECLSRHQSNSFVVPLSFVSGILLVAALIVGFYGLKKVRSDKE